MAFAQWEMMKYWRNIVFIKTFLCRKIARSIKKDARRSRGRDPQINGSEVFPYCRLCSHLSMREN